MATSITIKINEYEFIFTAGAIGIDGITISPQTIIDNQDAFMASINHALKMYPSYYAVCYINEGQMMESRKCSIDVLKRYIELYDTVINQNYFDVDKNKMTLEREECLLEIERKQKKEEKQIKSIPRNGYVYLVKSSTGHFKIGRSKNVDKRMSTFGIILPFEIDLICNIQTSNMYELERDLHDLFASKRINGEWFELNQDDIDYIKSLAE